MQSTKNNDHKVGIEQTYEVGNKNKHNQDYAGLFMQGKEKEKPN